MKATLLLIATTRSGTIVRIANVQNTSVAAK
jgi:hypothetical protein